MPLNNNESDATLAKVVESIRFLQAIQQSAKILYYYNHNQIQRMKIRKNEFREITTATTQPQFHMFQITLPFIPQILSNNFMVYFSMQNLLQDWTFYADWNKFELVMFNIIQNAVKYNTPGGKIFIIMKIAQTYDFKQGAMIETHIVDTGQGICPSRQSFLFKPFMELKAKQNFLKVKDRTTGIGLANSKDIAVKLDGDVFLTRSEPKFTVFTCRIPI